MTSKPIDIDSLDLSKPRGGLTFEEMRSIPEPAKSELTHRLNRYKEQEQERQRQRAKDFLKGLSPDSVYDVLAKFDHPVDTIAVTAALAKFGGLSRNDITNAQTARHLEGLLAAGRIERAKPIDGIMTTFNYRNGEVVRRGRWTSDRVGFVMREERSWFWWTVENGKVWDGREVVEEAAAAVLLETYQRCRRAIERRGLKVDGLKYGDPFTRGKPDDGISMPFDLFTSLCALAGFLPDRAVDLD